MLDTTEENPPRSRQNQALISGDLLLVACGMNGPRSVALPADAALVVGRHGSCQLPLSNPRVSRFHARFVRRGSSVMVEDLDSRHGTWLSDKRIRHAELTTGGAVRLADVVVTVTCAEAAGRALAVAPLPASAPESLYVGARMHELWQRLQRAATTDLPVVVFGETGTGKELVARELHRASGRKGPLRTVNCGAIPQQLIESMLFGHERGAFTGADRARAGMFEETNGGTLLLDEVGELSAAAQAALLRVIETRRLTRIGSNREIEVDARIVCATHRNLNAMAARGEFRADLLHRLCVLTLELPPLRERREEIAPLARLFLTQSQGAREIDPVALSRLEKYDWPGNIRELRNVLASAAALALGPCVTEGDLPENVRALGGSSLTAEVAYRTDSQAPGEPVHTLRTQLKLLERTGVLRALEQTGGNQRRAAALLGIPLRTFERRIRALRGSGS